MSDAVPTRDELATRYLDQLPYTPYPLQEEALLSWFSADQGTLVCAPTTTLSPMPSISVPKLPRLPRPIVCPPLRFAGCCCSRSSTVD